MTLLVIDVGSSSIRALLFDDEACPIRNAVCSYSHQFTTDPPGAAVADAEALRHLIEQCIDEILEHPQAINIRAVGMDTFVGNMLGVDKKWQAITPIYTYADTRSADQVKQLATQIDIQATHQRTGCLHHTAYHPARLHWLRETNPDLASQVTRWIDLGTYCYSTWFGETACSYSIASWSGLLNRGELQWDDGWLQLLKRTASDFPTLADYSTPNLGLVADYAERWPDLQDVPFFLAVGDGAAANIGLGAVDPRTIALTVGTTAALRVVTTASHPTVPDGLWGYRVSATHHLLGGATSEGGNIFQWARQTLNLDVADLEAKLGSSEAGQHGITFLPLLAGERSPGWATNATGSIHGLRLSTTPFDLLQAALESVALRLSVIADQLAETAADDAQIFAGGGALTSSLAWAQMITNAINRPLWVVDEVETTARGVAILILAGLENKSLTDFPKPAILTTLEPQAVSASRLQEARERQRQLYQKLIQG